MSQVSDSTKQAVQNELNQIKQANSNSCMSYFSKNKWWILVAIIVIGALLYWFCIRKKTNAKKAAANTTTTMSSTAKPSVASITSTGLPALNVSRQR
jgi:glucan phosphoethanolaminetransferase (alkaline phosphatase superfamily)